MPHTGEDATAAWTDAQWRAASSPARLQLITAIEGLGKSTVLALAEATGRSAPSLYPHLEVLERAGFVASAEEAVDGRRQRVYWPGPAMQALPVDPAAGRGLTRFARATKLLLDDASRRLARWAARAEGTPIGSGREARVFAVSHTTWLDDAQRAELNELIGRMNELLARARRERRGSLHSVIVAHFPDVRGDVTDPRESPLD
jgi:DNA-binding transcriptional ArsR family regulator